MKASFTALAGAARQGNVVKNIQVGVVLLRKPMILPKLDAQSHAYFGYKHEIDQALAKPFNSSFYYKKGSLSEKRFLDAQRIV
jgi:large subunit ribosomal protein L46